MIWRSSSGGTSPGTMTVYCQGQSELRSRGPAVVTARFDRYRYAAPADIAGSLAQFDQYVANVYTPADGLRRFLPRPEDGKDGYIARAFQIGLSLLTRDRRWNKATHDDYCVGKLAYDWVCHARERLKPRELSAEELVTPGRLRRDLLRWDALPEELTDGDDGKRGAELVHRIASAGAAAAATRGIVRPSETEIIALGLMDAAAARPPMIAEPQQIAGLVRGALFDFDDDGASISDEVWEEIGEQFEAAVRDRLSISQEQFNGWLYGKRAYMLQTVEKAAAQANDDPRSLVRRAMLELAWKGFGQVNECLHAFARAFERAIPRPLNDAERQLYAGMYRSQPYFGNFVLPLLLDAKDLLKYAILDLWESPGDPQAIEVLKRMLLYRSQILPRVREMQRRARAAGGAMLASATDEETPAAEDSPWDELTGHILEQRGMTCPDCLRQLTCTISPENRNRNSFVVDVGCPEHGRHRELTITRAELMAAHEALQGEDA